MQQFNNTPLNLELLAEECAEVIRAKSKLIRFGLDHTNPLTGNKSIEELEGEIGDLLAVVDVLIHHGTIDMANVMDGKRNKLERLKKWYSADACAVSR